MLKKQPVAFPSANEQPRYLGRHLPAKHSSSTHTCRTARKCSEERSTLTPHNSSSTTVAGFYAELALARQQPRFDLQQTLTWGAIVAPAVVQQSRSSSAT